MAYVNQEISQGTENPKLKKQLVQLKDAVQDNDYSNLNLLQEIDKEDLIAFIESQIDKCEFKALYRKKAIGYFASYKDASIVLAEYNKNPYDLSQSHTFAEVYALAYEDAGINKKSAKSIHAYKKAFERCSVLHSKQISDIRLIDLQTLIDEHANKSRALQVQLRSCFRLVFAYALKYELVVKDYSQHVKIREIKQAKDKTIFTPEEIQLLWDNADIITPQHNMEMACCILLLLYTGCRVNELFNVQLSDIDNDVIHIKGTKTKTSDRLVPVHSKIKPIIDRYLAEHKHYLIESVNGEHFGSDVLRYADFTHLNKSLGMDHTYHETRHTFATYSIDMKPVIRSYILGHSNHNITDDTYSHPEQITETLKSEIAKYNPC